ncbi:MAG: PKD domain-containing protein [Gemmatimonadota bacterium]
MGACALDDDIVRPGNLASISVRAAFAEMSAVSGAAAASVDRVRVLAIRPSSGETLAQAEATVTAGQQTVPIELSVELLESPEELRIRVELLAGDLLAYAGETLMLVDASKSVNESPTILLAPASPVLEVQPASLAFSLPRGEATESESVTVGNAGVGTMSWEASPDASWLSVSTTSGSLSAGGTTGVLVEVSGSGLESGSYSGTLTFTAEGAVGSPQSVAVGLVVEANQPPTANAGPDQTVADNDGSGDEVVTLDGSGSTDPDGTIASYVWTEGGTEIATGVTATVALGVGTHTITLTVTDDGGLSDADQVQITVDERPNQPPTANAGPDRTVTDADDSGSEAVTLDGTGSSDPDGTIASYVWTEAGFEIATGATPTVTLLVGTHTITLTVTDDGGLSDTDQVQITVAAPANQPPTANAGPDRAVTDSDASGAEAVTLDGTGSSDPDGTIVSYRWAEGGTQIATGVAPTVSLALGTHTITLTVTDNDGLSDSDQVQITVVSAPPPDLIIPTGAPTVTPSSVPPGGSITLSSWQVYNKGGSPSGSFSNGFYLSTDAVITTNDVYLSGNSNASLAPGTGYTWGGPTLTIPVGIAPGSYYVGILVDRAGQVAESDEGNNWVSTPLTVAATEATLTVVVDGVGVVTSSGVTPAINCDTNTCSATYPIGTQVTLTATQRLTDFVFESWFGTGTGFTCTTSQTCVVTMDQDRTVRAWFSSPGILSVNPSTASFTMLQGGSASPSSQTITVSNIGERPVSDVVIHDSYSPSGTAWLSESIDRTVIDTLTPGTMTLSVNPNSLAPGTYNATVVVGDFVVTTAQVNVTLTVQSPAPVISNLSVTLQQVNDTVFCSNGGSRFSGSFSFSDADGDVTLALATIRDSYTFSGGRSGTLVWPGAGYYTVGGNGFSGTISVVLCTVFATDTDITNTFTLEDGAGHVSNPLSVTTPRPAGSNLSPPPQQLSVPANGGKPKTGGDPSPTELPKSGGGP